MRSKPLLHQKMLHGQEHRRNHFGIVTKEMDFRASFSGQIAINLLHTILPADLSAVAQMDQFALSCLQYISGGDFTCYLWLAVNIRLKYRFDYILGFSRDFVRQRYETMPAPICWHQNLDD